ncbi:fluoride efflux transporter FluC [Salirhabdus salicampi]|uniref:fluoride efflux transporter FluC n=1 Tax=Salirhabdus salicampi TaxID=476102 RepID=UPI0020C26211|nr:CrcB family protein [Salirhabdus salicampi]MCP8617712.1 CrcB family protein [Salirhabdus salicampi]
MNWVLIFAGGALGAISRTWFGRQWNKSALPWGTWLANVVGSTLLAVLFVTYAHQGIRTSAFTLLSIGFCGAFTTMSTFSLETVQLIQANKLRSAFMYVLSSVLTSLAIVGIVLFTFLST